LIFITVFSMFYVASGCYSLGKYVVLVRNDDFIVVSI